MILDGENKFVIHQNMHLILAGWWWIAVKLVDDNWIWNILHHHILVAYWTHITRSPLQNPDFPSVLKWTRIRMCVQIMDDSGDKKITCQVLILRPLVEARRNALSRTIFSTIPMELSFPRLPMLVYHNHERYFASKYNSIEYISSWILNMRYSWLLLRILCLIMQNMHKHCVPNSMARSAVDGLHLDIWAGVDNWNTIVSWTPPCVKGGDNVAYWFIKFENVQYRENLFQFCNSGVLHLLMQWYGFHQCWDYPRVLKLLH